MEMLMIGDSFSARQALEMGLLNYVVPKAQLMDKALELAGKLAANGPLAVRKVKEGIMRSSGLPLDQAYQVENDVSAVVMQSQDAREGPRAFTKTRKPEFIGA
jgi:enoyl-CoA hydratase